MQTKINGDSPFQIMAHSFAVAKTESGFTLAYSADGANFTAYSEATPANEVLMVNGVPKNCWFKLSGCTDNNVIINY